MKRHAKLDGDDKWRKLGKKLELDYLIVGVKIHKRDLPEEGEKSKITYCQAIKKVAEGYVDRIVMKKFECPSPELVFGFVRPKYVQIEDVLENGTKCVEIFVMKDDLDADVIIFLVNAEQAMKIIAMLDRYGHLNFKVSSSMALCRDATVIPILTGRLNISFLCGGARMYCGFDNNILALGIPTYLCEALFKEYLDLTPTERYILYILERKYRKMPAKEIAYDSGLPNRTIRNSLQSLHKKGLIEKRIDIKDARTTMYWPKKKRVNYAKT